MVRMAKETVAFPSVEVSNCASEPHQVVNSFSNSLLFREIGGCSNLFRQFLSSLVEPQHHNQPCAAVYSCWYRTHVLLSAYERMYV